MLRETLFSPAHNGDIHNKTIIFIRQPKYIFLIDVSATAQLSGALPLIANTIRETLDSLPGQDRTQVCLKRVAWYFKEGGVIL